MADLKARALVEFKAIDKDGSGILDKTELKNSLKAFYAKEQIDMTDAQIDNMVAIADKNKDGKINIEEFIVLMP